MLRFLASIPVNASHPASCEYGNTLWFIPLNPHNPFVAIWQTDLVVTAVLLVVGLGMVALGRARGQHGRSARLVGYLVLVGAAASAVLTAVALASSRPPACYGAPGAGPPPPAQQQLYSLFQSLLILSEDMAYVAALLVLVAIVTAVVTLVRRHAKS